jgi:hypothetical protein
MAENQPPISPTEVAFALAQTLEQRRQDYAFGGAIALGYWGLPRGTMDVDLTIFLSPDQPEECVRLLEEIGCQVPVANAIALLKEHGLCRASYAGLRVDVFTPTIPFYQLAKNRRRRVPLKTGHIMIWDAETLAVFKMMFFRDKDLVDLKKILSHQKATFDHDWVRAQLIDVYGQRDTRILRWDELVGEAKA